MNFNNFVKIKSFCENITSGGTPSRKVHEYYGGDINWFKTQELLDANLYESEEKITELGLRKSSAKFLPKNTISMAMYGATVGRLGILKNGGTTNQACCNMIVKEKNNYMFLFYWLLYERESIIKLTSGAAQQNLNLNIISNYKILNLDREHQDFIVKQLNDLDNKIELNNKINNNLEKLAQTLYKHWFVDFEFPNEEGLPYKSSGGKMVESDLGLIPEGWEIREQGDYFPVITGKKNANYATLDGKFKFFTCSQQVFQAPDYSFDGTAILVAGNGDFNVKYYSGKFEAYQRTYVLIPKNSNLAGLFYFMIKENLNKMTSCHRGSVIKFITKGDLENYKIITPDNEKLEKLSYYFTNIINTIEHNKSENEKLTKLRDLLLPKLMSGEIRVPIEEE